MQMEAEDGILSIFGREASMGELIRNFLEQISNTESNLDRSGTSRSFENGENLEEALDNTLKGDWENNNQFKNLIYNPRKNRDMSLKMKGVQSKDIRRKELSESCSDNNTKMQIQIKALERKIKKKDELIKYLERKCGQQIIKSTTKIYQKISELEQQNQRLAEELSQVHRLDSNFLNISKLTDNISSQNQLNLTNNISQLDFEGLNQKQLHNYVLIQAKQIQKLQATLENRDQKILQYSKSNKELRETLQEKLQQIKSLQNNGRGIRKHSSLSKRDFLDNISDENTPNSMSKINILNNSITSHESSAKQKDNSDKNSENYLTNKKEAHKKKVNKLGENVFVTSGSQTQIFTQCEQQIQTDEDQQFIRLLEENRKNEQRNQELSEQIRHLELEYSSFKQKIESCYENIEQFSMTSPRKSDGQFDADHHHHAKSEIEINYLELLDIFGIEWDESDNHNEIHEMLLAQISNLKKQLSRMLKQFRKLEREIQKLYEQKEQFQKGLEEEKNINVGMNDYIGVLTQQLQFSNQLIMKNKILAYNEKFNVFDIESDMDEKNPILDLQKHRKTSPEEDEDNEYIKQNDEENLEQVAIFQ